MKTKALYKLIILQFIILNSFPIQAQEISFHKTYGGPDEDHLNCIETTLDGGYIMGGHTTSYGPHPTLNETNIYLIKTNDKGNAIWNKVFSSAYWNKCLSINSTADSGFMVLNSFYEPSVFKNDFGICEIDKSGNIGWNKRYSSSGIDEDIATCFLKTSDGYYVSGYTLQNFDNGREVFLMKIDNNGEVLWTRTYMKAINQGTFTGDLSAPKSLTLTSSGDLLITGLFQNYSANDNRILILRVDKMGNLKWIKTFTNDVYNTDNVKACELNDGSFLIGSTSVVQGRELDMILLKTDSVGNYQWCKSYGDSLNETMRDMLIAEDGVILLGESNSFTPYGQKIYILKTDFEGNIIYEHLHGGLLSGEYAKSGKLLNDGSLAIGGFHYSSKTYEEFFLMKTNKNIEVECEETPLQTLVAQIGLSQNSYFSEDTIQMKSSDFIMKVDSGISEHELCGPASTNEKTTDNNFKIYPNPFTNELIINTVNVLEKPVKIVILNLLGQEVYTLTIDTNNQLLQFIIEPKLNNGTYILKMDSGRNSFITKIVKAQ